MTQQKQTITIRGEQIALRELTWKETLDVGKRVSGTLLALVGSSGVLALDAGKLVSAIISGEEITEILLEKTTGKDAQWVSTLSAREALELLNRIVETHLSEDLISAGKSLGGRVVSALNIKAAVQQN